MMAFFLPGVKVWLNIVIPIACLLAAIAFTNWYKKWKPARLMAAMETADKSGGEAGN